MLLKPGGSLLVKFLQLVQVPHLLPQLLQSLHLSQDSLHLRCGIGQALLLPLVKVCLLEAKLYGFLLPQDSLRVLAEHRLPVG